MANQMNEFHRKDRKIVWTDVAESFIMYTTKQPMAPVPGTYLGLPQYLKWSSF